MDPAGFRKTAALSDSFPGSTAARAMAALQANPRAILVDEQSAEELKLKRGKASRCCWRAGPSSNSSGR